MKKLAVAALFSTAALCIVVGVAYATGLTADWLTIGGVYGADDAILFNNATGLVFFNGQGEMTSLGPLRLTGEGMQIESYGDLAATASGSMETLVDERLTLEAFDQVKLVSEDSILLMRAHDCEGEPEGEAEGEGEQECFEDLFALYLGDVTENTPECVTEFSVRAMYGDISIAAIDAAWNTRAGIFVREDGDIRLQSNIADDESGDHEADPRASITCTADGDIILQLGGAAE